MSSEMEDEQPTLEAATAARLVRRHTVSVSQLSPPSSPPALSVRKPSLSASSLPPLDLSALPDPASASSSSLCSARRAVDAITSALSRVRPYLHVTSAAGARDLHALRGAGVTHVVNLAGATIPKYHPQSMAYLQICARDDAEEDISVVFDDTTAFIDAAREARTSVAVHCHMGISRSVTIAAAYLMMTEGVSAEAAVADVRRARPVADPNPSFVTALSGLQRRMRAGLLDPVLLRVQPLAPATDVSYLVGVPYMPASRDPGDLGDEHAWILVLPARQGVEVVLGSQAPDRECARALELAKTIARHEERYESMFPVTCAAAGDVGTQYNSVVSHGNQSVQQSRLRGLQRKMQRHILRDATPAQPQGPYKCHVRVLDRGKWSPAVASRLLTAACDGIVQ